MRSFNDPEGAAEIFRAKHAAAVAEFYNGTVSDDVFCATLYGLGFRGSELRSEFNLHDEEKNAKTVEAKTNFQRSSVTP